MDLDAQENKGKNAKYSEKTEEGKRSIRDLKNLVSGRMDQKMVFSHNLTLDSCDIENFFSTKESDRYKNNLTRQVPFYFTYSATNSSDNGKDEVATAWELSGNTIGGSEVFVHTVCRGARYAHGFVEYI